MSKIPPEDDLQPDDGQEVYDELQQYIDLLEQGVDPPPTLPTNFFSTSTRNIRRFNSKTEKISGMAYKSFIRFILKNRKSYVYISPSGSDITGNGSRRKPYHTPHKAYSMIGSTGPNAILKYIIAKDGVYDLDNILDTPGSTLAFISNTSNADVLFFGNNTVRDKNIVLISENLHGCKIKGSISLTLDTSYGINGISLGIKRYKIDSKHLPFASDIKKIDFSLYDYNYNGPHNVTVTSPTTLVPCMLNKGTTGAQYPELYLTYPTAFTYVGPSLPLSRFVPYAGTSTPGLSLYGFTGTEIFNIITTRNSLPGVTTNWTDTTLVMYGGNNDSTMHKIVGISYAESKINIEGRPHNLPVSNIAFIANKSWLGNTYEYAFEMDGNQKYFYVKSDSNIVPRLPLIDFGINLCGVSNIQFIGFDIFEFRNSNIGFASNDQNTRGNITNLTFKYNASHHTDYVAFLGDFKNSSVQGNLIYKTTYRGLYFNDCTNVDVKYNTIVGWKQKTGIYMSGCSGMNVYNNNLYTLAALHGNGMAFYQGCRNINIEKNYIFVPSNFGIAIQDYTGKSGDIGYTIKNNVIFSDVGLKIYEVNKTGNYRGDLVNFDIQNNVGSFQVNEEYFLSSQSANNKATPWWKFYRYIYRNNFCTGPINLIKPAIDVMKNLPHLVVGSSGINGNYILGTTAQLYSNSPGGSFIINAPQSIINDFYSGLGIALYTGMCGPASWTNSWLPGVTINGTLIRDAKAISRFTARYPAFDGITCHYNNLFMCEGLNEQLSASVYSVGSTFEYDYVDPQTKSRLLNLGTRASTNKIFQPNTFFDAPSGNSYSLQIFLIDPTAEDTGRYDFRLKPTIQDYQANQIQTSGIGVDWIGPNYKGFTYTQFMTNNFYDWWLYNEGT